MNRVDIVIPVLNEEVALALCVSKLLDFVSKNLNDYNCRVVVADNGSDDRTLQVAHELAKQFGMSIVSILHLDERGRGRALRRAWLDSSADVLVYMDVDLSTDLNELPALISSISVEGFDLSTGSRLKSSAKTKRSLKRELISRSYNLLIKLLFRTRFSDAQCGFKAISNKAAQALIPFVKNNHWFFDTELLILAEKSGFKIKDIPVKWEEDSDTRVKLVKTIFEDLRGLARLKFSSLPKIPREWVASNSDNRENN